MQLHLRKMLPHGKIKRKLLHFHSFLSDTK